MPTLDATVGGASSNSYSTVEGALAYFDNRLHCSAFTGASSDDQERALIMASLLFDRWIEWGYHKASTDQAMYWPCSDVYDDNGYLIGTDTLPDELVNSVRDFALILIGQDTTAPSGTSGIKSLKVDVISLDFDKQDRVNPIPFEVFAPLAKWGALRGNRSTIEVQRA